VQLALDVADIYNLDMPGVKRRRRRNRCQEGALYPRQPVLEIQIQRCCELNLELLVLGFVIRRSVVFVFVFVVEVFVAAEAVGWLEWTWMVPT